MMKISIFLFFVSLLCVHAESSYSLDNLQDQIKITGIITDQNGEPLPGVNIRIRGSDKGTISDVSGNFEVYVDDRNAVLLVSYVGFLTQEFRVGTNLTINFQLKEDIHGLEEVVVVGYKTQIKEAISGSVATINASQLQIATGSNVEQKMQGMASGVTVINSHTPGDDATIIIRGLGTINDNSPLFVIDGVPTHGNLSQINPNDIASISILKDAASAAIYGARGANGVILIATNRGVKGKTKVSFTSNVGWGTSGAGYDLLNTQEYADLLWMEYSNSGQPPNDPYFGNDPNGPVIPDYVIPPGAMEGDPGTDPALYDLNTYAIARANKEGTDWYGAMQQVAPVQEYNLNISGGSDKVNYSISGGYRDEQGILMFTGFQRYSFRSNIDIKINNWFKVGESFGLAYTNEYGNQGDNSEFAIIATGYRNTPLVSLYDIMGNFGGETENSVAILTRDVDDYSKIIRPIGNFYAQIDFLKDFQLKSLFGYDYYNSNSRDRELQNPESSMARHYDMLSMQNQYAMQWNFSNTLTYRHIFADVHNVNVILGTEAISSDSRILRASRTDYFSSDPNYMTLDTGTKNFVNGGNGVESRTSSIFGRVDYDLLGKYIFQATVRRDGSSNFGRNNRFGTFPAFSTGWRISKEDFMSGTSNWLDYLKMRFAYGQTGNDRITGLNAFTTFHTSKETSYYSIDGDETHTQPGFESYTAGNPNAHWETTTTLDIGLDAVLLNRIYITADYWRRNTSDMLYPLAIPATWGDAIAPSINIGDMQNVGWDLKVRYNDKSSNGDFTFSVTANLTHYKNEIIKISDVENEAIFGNPWQGYIYTKTEAGHSFPEFYGYVVDGIFQTPEEADSHPVAFNSDYNMPGHYKFRDVTNIDNETVIDDNDRTYIGSPHPDLTGGINIDLSYRNIGLNAFFYGSYGNDMVNYVNLWTNYKFFTGNRSKDRLYNSWGSEYLDNNTDAVLPIAELNDSHSKAPSTAFIEDASYLRLKNLQLSYSLPKSLLDKINVSSFRLFIQANNLFTLTRYSGLDPEVGGGIGMSMGIDAGAWPTAKQLLIGVSLSL